MGKRRTLNREKVVAKAIEMADQAGRPEAITLAALAAELNIRTPSLYNHISNMEDLQLAMALWGLEQQNVRVRQAAAGKIGLDALWAIAQAHRAFMREHPGIYALTFRGPDPGQETLQAISQELINLLLLVMGSLGLTGSDAIHAIRGFRALLHGFTSLEAAGGFKMALDVEESFRYLVEAFVKGLSRRQTSDFRPQTTE
ncbi:MAG: WHG domain-containing protein [Ardenticatenaceae bacterium]|nr:WHG domain-containing protein [Ardenticatenaceae bacterium]